MCGLLEKGSWSVSVLGNFGRHGVDSIGTLNGDREMQLRESPGLSSHKEVSMAESAQLPPAALMMMYEVADFDAWKTVFDANEQGRIDNGFVGHHINRSEGDPNALAIYLAVGDIDAARAYAESDELKSLMAQAGVSSPPERMWVTPLRESAVFDRELPAMILSHRVEDLDAWLEGYDAAAELQAAGGIIGHAANQSIDDPALVVVYHQAESFDTLRAFLRSDELRTAMKEAGVASEPEVTFHTGGFGKRY